MADETPSLQIDTDWKKQAQEEKRKLAEKAAEQKAAQAKAAESAVAGAPTGAAASPAGRRAERGAPEPVFTTLVQQMMTQAMLYLGELSYRGAPPMLDLDMARHQHDLLTMLEQKTQNNLNDEEQKALDLALHEVRTRFSRAAVEQMSF